MRPEPHQPRHAIGSCPDCGTAIPSYGLLIEYETADGGSARYAECPSCRDVVHPA